MGRGEQLCQIKQYVDKHQRYPSQVDVAPATGLGLIVVIPCYDESYLTATLEALLACRAAPVDIEVIIVVNASRRDPPTVHTRNAQTFTDAEAWILARKAEACRRRMVFHLVRHDDLPSRHAGVGLARKIGMDAAVARLCLAGNPNGIVVSLDADCACDRNYLQQIDRHFAFHPDAAGCSIYFEHPLDLAPDARSRRAIVNYELFLRYYKHGLKLASSPYAHYTLGSCMAVRGAAYARQGGMNRRRAGEDFHFLQQLIRGGHFTELTTTRVLPSPRLSRRVPFGTGRAIEEQLARRNNTYLTYSPLVFRDLAVLFRMVSGLFRVEGAGTAWLNALPIPVAKFLQGQGFVEQLTQMRSNAASPRTLLTRFHHWFDGVRTARYARWSTTTRYGWMPIERAASSLLMYEGAQAMKGSVLPDVELLLSEYRRLDRTAE